MLHPVSDCVFLPLLGLALGGRCLLPAARCEYQRASADIDPGRQSMESQQTSLNLLTMGNEA